MQSKFVLETWKIVFSKLLLFHISTILNGEKLFSSSFYDFIRILRYNLKNLSALMIKFEREQENIWTILKHIFMCVKQFVLNKWYIIFIINKMSKVFILFFINGLVCFYWQQSLCKIKTKRFVPDITLNLMLNMFYLFQKYRLKRSKQVD